MSHHVIQYFWIPEAYKRMPRATEYAERLIIKLEKVCCLDCYVAHRPEDNAERVAEKISRCRAIEKVVVTWVSETPVGVWRSGRRS